MSRNLEQALGDRLYPAARIMFNEIFGKGQHGILIGGAARNIYLPQKPRQTKDLDIRADETAFKKLRQPPKQSYFLFSPGSDSTKYSATYLTNDKRNSVKSDVRLRTVVFQQPLIQHTILDPVSGIRYPTIQHLVALKIAGFISRSDGQDGKKEKDMEDIVDLSEEMFANEMKMSSELVDYYLGPKGWGIFLNIVKSGLEEHYEHMIESLEPLIIKKKLRTRSQSPSRTAQSLPGTAPSQVLQGASTVTQAVRKGRGTPQSATTVAASVAARPATVKKVESKQTASSRRTPTGGPKKSDKPDNT